MKIFKDIKYHITYYPKVFWYYIEIYFSEIQKYFGYHKDKSVIPIGQYCYTIDEERNIKEPISGYWIKPCKYYRSMKGLYAGCTYVGFIGHDFCLGDQCKICGERYGDDIDFLIQERKDKISKILNNIKK